MKRIKAYIQSHKGRSLLIIFVVTLVLYVGSSDTGLKTERAKPTPTSTTQPQPEGTFRLTQISPEGDIIKSIWSVEPITFYFDDVLDMTTIAYTVTPQTDTFVRGDIEEKNPTSFTIVPRKGWDQGVRYTIRIKPTLRSMSNKILNAEIVKTFSRQSPSAEELNIPETAF